MMFKFINENEYEICEVELKKYIKYLDFEMDNKCNFTIVIVNSKMMQELNYEFRDKDYPTDVLTFCEDENDYLGDIIINYDIITLQADKFNHTFKREFYFLVTHGYLHLLGFDHIEYDEEQEMFKLQKKLLNDYNIRR